MKFSFLYLLAFAFLSCSLQAQSNNPDYVKYEFEDVGPYRQRYDFSLPKVENEVIPVETPSYQSLENRFFTQGNKVHIEADSRLAQFVNLHKQINSKISTVEGYRIQIFAGTSRDNAERAKARFLGQFPGMPSYLVHFAPNYRVRVGDFLEKNEAQKVCNQVRDSFPGAFVVPDEVSVNRYKSGKLSDD